jgi:cobyrinic acid a,c-diamide synthase
VQVFKTRPDLIDPMIFARATGQLARWSSTSNAMAQTFGALAVGV